MDIIDRLADVKEHVQWFDLKQTIDEAVNEIIILREKLAQSTDLLTEVYEAIGQHNGRETSAVTRQEMKPAYIRIKGFLRK